MSPLLRRALPVVIGLATLATALAAAATVVADWDLGQVLAHAQMVVAGTVAEQRVVAADEGGLLTETVVDVERWLLPRSETLRRVTVTQLGGTIGRHGEGIAGDVHLRRGQRVLLMLERLDNGRTMIVGLVLGAYFAVGATQPIIWAQHVGVAVVRPDGQVTPPPGLRTLEMAEVEALLAESGR